MKLTDEEIKDILVSIDPDTKRLPPGFRDFARSIEAALSAKQGEQEPVKYEKQAFCYCDKDVSLQMVSGGGAPEGYLGRVTLRIGDQYRDYYAHPAPSVNAQEANNYEVICPKCVHQFRAIPMNVQERISELEAQNAQLLEALEVMVDNFGLTPSDKVIGLGEARAAIAAVQSNASTHSLNSANSLE